MSGLLHTNQVYISQQDRKHADERFFGNEDLFLLKIYENVWSSDDDRYGFRTPWWPGAGSIFDDSGFMRLDVTHAAPWFSFGANGRLAFVGTTRNEYGSAVGGCTVRCFRTVDNSLQSIVTSDANGNYIATTPYLENHYLVVHKSGSPEIAGASISTAQPG